jgi:hypothetical protein
MHAALSLVAVAFLLTMPGDVLRRAAVPRWRLHPLWLAAVDVLLSMVVLIAIGLSLAAAGRFSMVGLGLVVAMAGFGLIAWLRRGVAIQARATLGVFAAVGVLAGAGIVLLSLKQTVPDRIALGQLDTAVEVAKLGAIPELASSFGSTVAFPTHYLFYDVVMGTLLIASGSTTGQGLLELMAALRVPTAAWLGLCLTLAGMDFLAIAIPRSQRFGPWLRLALGVTLPAVALFNIVIEAKVREALTEGIALGLLGLGLAAAFRATDGHGRRRFRWSVIAGSAIGVIAGTHLPALAGAALILGPWFALALLAALAAEARPHLGDAQVGRRAGRRLAALIWRFAPMVAIPLGALLAYDIVGGGTLGRLLGGAVGQGASDPAAAFRALLLLSADPLSRATPAEFLQRYLQPGQMFVDPAFGALAASLLGLGAAMLALSLGDVTWRVPVWIAIGVAGTLLYADSAVLIGATTIEPWNAIMRNSYYVWLPLAFVGLLGAASVPMALNSVAGRFRRGTRWVWLAPMVGIALVAAMVLQPVARAEARQIRGVGWLTAGQMTPAGFRALTWLAQNTPFDAVVLMPEVTYGSELIAGRTILSEGKGTLESSEVTAAAIRTLDATIAFYLPSHDPSILIDGAVDYVVAFGEGPYAQPQFGGLPLLRSYIARVSGLEPMSALAYLTEVHRDTGVVIYAVARERVPAIQVDQVPSRDAPAPPCTHERCLVYFPTAEGCPPDAWTAHRFECVLIRLPSDRPT